MRERGIPRRNALQASALMAGALGVGACRSGLPADTLPAGSFAHNVEVVGYSDLDNRPGFKMAVRQTGGRWYLYLGHFWHSGWSVVDVTDPARPEVALFQQGPVNTWTLQVDLSGDIMVTALERVFPDFGGDPSAPFEEGIYLWDIADPIRPKRLGHFRTGGTGTHRNHYPGGRYVHLAAGMPGYHGNIYLIVDIADPSRPTEVGRWWVPGQHTAGGENPAGQRAAQDGHLSTSSPCCSSGHDVSLHGPAYVSGSHAYLPYGGAGMVVLDISDVSAPKQIGHLSFSPPFHSRFGVHSVLPIPQKGIAFVNSEHTAYADGAAHHASIVDITDPANPFLLSLFPAPVPPPDAPYADFATRGGWRGPHNINHHQHHPDVQRQGDLFYIAHFNAGLRIYDVSNPYLVREVGYFLPPEPTKRYGPMPEGELVLQTEDVVVDRRGFIYITDKNQGLWILRYTGPLPRH
ncbi:LVIVD repeat-containing protein [Nocardia asteroides]